MVKKRFDDCQRNRPRPCLSSAPAAPPHLQLDDGPELSPRRVPDHHQLALDDDWLEQVEVLVRLAASEVDRPQHAGRTGCLDEDTAVNLVGGAGGHEHEAVGAGLDAVG